MARKKRFTARGLRLGLAGSQNNLPLDSLWVVAMSTLFAPVPFCEKPSIPVCGPGGGTEGLARGTYGTHITLTLSIRLLGVDNPCLNKTT